MEESISINQYIDIFSSATGGAVVSRREPIGRLFTLNELVPVGTTLRFTNANDVMSYFGVNSTEYKVAYKYFNWVSKRISRAKAISFDRLVQSATPATVISGKNIGNALNSLKKSSFQLNLTLGDDTYSIDADTSNAESLSDVASILNDALDLGEDVITINSNLNGTRFVLKAPTSTDDQWIISPTADAVLLAWTESTGVINSYGVTNASILDQVKNNLSRNNNCYTLGFLCSLSNDEVEAIASWVHAQNNMFVFCYATDKNSLQNIIQPLVSNYSGTWLQVDVPGEFQFWQPMAITANIDYTKEHASSNYEFHQFATDTATVFTDVNKTALDAVKINYLGRTQQAGKPLVFLQEGWLQGSVKDMTVYVNEIWLKDSIITELMSLFLRKNAVYSNNADMAIMAGVCFDVFAQAIVNGTILKGTKLNNDERASIEALTNDELAYSIIEEQGYIFEYSVSTLEGGKKAFSYRLIYKGCDTIRKAEGTNIIITSTAGQ